MEEELRREIQRRCHVPACSGFLRNFYVLFDVSGCTLCVRVGHVVGPERKGPKQRRYGLFLHET